MPDAGNLRQNCCHKGRTDGMYIATLSHLHTLIDMDSIRVCINIQYKTNEKTNHLVVVSLTFGFLGLVV